MRSRRSESCEQVRLVSDAGTYLRPQPHGGHEDFEIRADARHAAESELPGGRFEKGGHGVILLL
jgi:hypothetical protein